jgi:hypothetical protein
LGVEQRLGLQYQAVRVCPLRCIEIDDLYGADREARCELLRELARHLREQVDRLDGGEGLEYLARESGRFCRRTYRSGAIDVRYDHGHRGREGGQLGEYVRCRVGLQAEMTGEEPEDLGRGHPGRARHGGGGQFGRHGRRVEVVQGQPLAVLRVAEHQEPGDQMRSTTARVACQDQDARGAGPLHPPGGEGS